MNEKAVDKKARASPEETPTKKGKIPYLELNEADNVIQLINNNSE